MSFTYDLAATGDDLLIAKVRLELGDTEQDAGVKPNGANFEDEEIATWLDEESDHVMHTVIRACQALARMWSNVASVTVGPRSEQYGKIADNWDRNIKTLSDQYGPPAGSGGGFGVASKRVDGYSETASVTQ